MLRPHLPVLLLFSVLSVSLLSISLFPHHHRHLVAASPGLAQSKPKTLYRAMTSADKANFETGRGLHAADKSATYTPEDHQMGDLATQFISTSKAPVVAKVYNEEEGHGILKIDTAKVPAFKKNSIDMHKYMKKRHQKNSGFEKVSRIEQEVLIKHEIPQEACSLFLERRDGGGGPGESVGELLLYRRGKGSKSCAGGKGGKPGAARAPQSAPGAAKGKASTVPTTAAAKPPKASPKRAKR
ncbi:hypothetical protein DFJ73DRAFT_779282 [Zopfochytrium polystomum]|nr:hypothetical protein DFJ73DRAFT_779282 [Zopfochytrium polystomum]